MSIIKMLRLVFRKLKAIIFILLKSKTVVAIGLIVISIAIFALLKATAPESQKTNKTEKSYPVSAQIIHKQSLHPELNLYGKVESPYNSTITSVIVADIRRLSSLEGKEVRKGQVLMRLDPQNITLLVKQRAADLASVKSKLRTNQKELKRQESLFARHIISLSAVERYRQTVASLEADFNRVKARYNQIKNDKLRSTVLAPFSGRITKIFVSPGDRVNIGSKLLSIYDTNNLEIRAQIPNNILSKLRDLWSENKSIKALVNQHIKANLSRITGEVKTNSAGIDALFKVNGRDSSLSLGQAVQLTVQLPIENNVMPVPYEAVYWQNKIYLIKDSRLQLTEIHRLGQFTKDNKTYILIDASSFNNKDVMLLSQLPNAISGLKVDIKILDGKPIMTTNNN